MAKRFKFPLQPVLDQRQKIEDQKMQVVALRQRAHDDAQRELERLNTDFNDATRELREQHKSLSADALRLHYAHLQFLDRSIIAQIRVLAERKVMLERARQELLAASKDRKVVEKLKERRHEAYVAEEQRQEQLALDDGNARRHGRVAL